MQHSPSAPDALRRPAVPAMRPPGTSLVDDVRTLEAAVARIADLVLKTTSLADRYEAARGRRSPEAAGRIATLRSTAEYGRQVLLALV